MPEEARSFRPFWSGTITFGLVSIPVQLLPANRPRSVSFRMLSPEGNPLQRKYFPSEGGEEELSGGEIVRGYETDDGKFVTVTEEELEALEPKKSRDIDLRRFVDRDELDPVFFQRAYFLVPGGESTKAYKLLAAVMEKNHRAGIATFVMRGKEYLVAILADSGILRAETLRFHDEIRSAEDVGLPEKPKLQAKLVKAFETEIGKTSRPLKIAELTDEYAERLEKVVKKKQKKGEGIVEVEVEPEEEQGGEVVDLMEALKRSLAGGGRRPPQRARGDGKNQQPRRAVQSKKSKEDLYEQAKKLDIPGRSRMSKEELIEAIRAF